MAHKVHAEDVVGWYDFSWAEGSFPVCFRPGGAFYCPKFPQGATWNLDGSVVKIDWKRFGKFELKFEAKSKSMSGRSNSPDHSWRSATWMGPLSPEEQLLLGHGGGSEWVFVWQRGKFPVKFKADGRNRFKCEFFPAHAHWSLEGKTLRIDWCDYGTYELVVNVTECSMEGCLVGGDPEKDWRKAKFMNHLAISQCKCTEEVVLCELFEPLCTIS
ncbi:Hypothetical protein SCF082_LOCUS28144 [Durusdinium trenchii]|uniref:Uncharacterized protein n=1 Tax=Durusdinium trenchii TaxID=1381693 RepID=A0ABP0MJD2_9DINO